MAEKIVENLWYICGSESVGVAASGWPGNKPSQTQISLCIPYV